MAAISQWMHPLIGRYAPPSPRKRGEGINACLSLIPLLLAVALSAPACAKPLKVVASFSVLADLVRNAGGATVEVTSIIGPDRDPHGYEPRPSDARALADASVLVVNGLGFDGWAGRLAAAAGFHGVMIVASRDVSPILHGGAPDPHAWQSVPNAIVYVGAISRGLVAADPEDADALRASAEACRQSLTTLDAEIRAILAPIPDARRKLVVPHQAFDYFGQAYGLSFLSPLGTNADAEATASAMGSLVAALRNGAAQAILAEHLEDRRAVDRIAEEAHMPVAGELYSDALSAKDGPAATYADMMRFNARIIASALTGGAAPGSR